MTQFEAWWATYERRVGSDALEGWHKDFAETVWESAQEWCAQIADALDVTVPKTSLDYLHEQSRASAAADIAADIREGAPAKHAPDALSLLLAMTPEQRCEAFGKFCTQCGRDNPDCRCWSDE